MSGKAYNIVASQFGETFSGLIEEIQRRNDEGLPISWNRPWMVDPASKKEDALVMGMSGLPINGGSNRMYSGSNVPVLYFTQLSKGWVDPRWFTFNQIKKLGLEFKDEIDRRHTKVLHYSEFESKDRRNDKDDGVRRSVRYYRVWNGSQLEMGALSLFGDGQPGAKLSGSDDKIVKRALDLGAEIRHGGSRAFYSPGFDFVQMPEEDKFHTNDGYHSVMYHELTHWTGHTDRLNRKHPSPDESDKKATFNEEYAWEELVAELGASFLCSHTDRDCTPQHVEYLRIWKERALKDPAALLQAAKCASDAAMMLIPERDKKGGAR